MGLYDRQYIREDDARPRLGGLSATGWLIASNVVVFVLQILLSSPTAGSLLDRWGAFSTARGFFGLEVWRFVTFQFLHANLIHIGFNMLGLWIFGTLVEQHLGARRYLAFYLVCGIFGALLYLLLNLLGHFAMAAGAARVPGLLFNDPNTPLVGASAGVFGVIMACAYVAPNVVMQLLIPPVPVRMKLLAYAYVGLALLSLLLGTQNAGGEAAHVGGAVAGFFFIRNSHLLRDFFDVFEDSRLGAGGRSGGKARPARPGPMAARRERTGQGARAGRGGLAGIFGLGGGRGGGAGGAPSQEDVDKILDKVAREGIHALSEREKRTLQRATDSRRAG